MSEFVVLPEDLIQNEKMIAEFLFELACEEQT
jgi:hypothetical protein